MGTQALLNKSTSPPPGPKRQTLEPLDIAITKEHVSHRNDFLVDLHRVAREDDAFGDYAVAGGREGCACCDEGQGARGGGNGDGLCEGCGAWE